MVTVNDTIAAGKAWLRSVLDDGAPCPLCGQNAKMYRRKITSGMARSLIHMHRMAPYVGGQSGWIHVSTIPSRSRDHAMLAYWGLIEEQLATGVHGGKAGYWRVTDRGRSFLIQGLKVPKYALVYDGTVQGFDSTDMVDIHAALGTNFYLPDLMAGV